MNKSKSKLFIKFSLIIAVVIVITLSVTGFFLVKFQEKRIISEKEKSWERFVEYLAQTTAVNLYRYDYFALDESTKILQKNDKNDSEILAVRILDQSGKKNNPSGIEISDIRVPEKYRMVKEYPCIYKPYLSDRQILLGKVVIICSTESVYNEIRNIQVIYVLIIVILIVVILAVLTIIIKINVTGPIDKIKTQIKEFEKGNLSKVEKRKNDDEIAELSFTFYDMALKLKLSFEQVREQLNEIKMLNQNLEIRVDERTMELKKSIEKLIETQEQLVETEKMAALGGLVAGVAHEVNTPIGVCLTAVSYMVDKTEEFKTGYKEERIGKEDLEEYLETTNDTAIIILKNIERAAELIHSFKQVAVDQTSEEKRFFNVKAYIETILQSLHPKWKKTKHKIEIVCDENIEIKSYPGALHQIISNLIINSLIHGFEGIEKGEMRLTVKEKNEDIILTYEDNGIGMSKENLEKIYEPFFTTKRAHGGTGLGMNIVYNIVSQKIKLSISAHSELGKGIRFEIVIPKSA